MAEVCREIYRKPCPCSRGEVAVEVCRPDTPYPRTKRYQGSFTCPSCGEKYRVIEQGTDVMIVEKSEIKKREKFLKEWNQACEELLSATKVINILKKFRELLAKYSNLPRLAEYLRMAGIIQLTDQEFEEEFGDPASWVKHHIRVSQLPRILDVLGLEDPPLVDQVKALEPLWKKSKIPYEPVGRPLFKKDPF